MTNNTKKAILLDVDGPLNPFNAKIPPEGYTTHRMHPTGFEYGNGLRVLLNPLHGLWLANLGAEIIWATMWEHDANEWIGPHIGLPELAVIDWDDSCTWGSNGLHYKTKRIVTWMNKNRKGVDFLWIDDECTKYDSKYIGQYSDAKGNIMRISPKTGITDNDMQMIELWAGNNEV